MCVTTLELLEQARDDASELGGSSAAPRDRSEPAMVSPPGRSCQARGYSARCAHRVACTSVSMFACQLPSPSGAESSMCPRRSSRPERTERAIWSMVTRCEDCDTRLAHALHRRTMAASSTTRSSPYPVVENSGKIRSARKQQLGARGPPHAAASVRSERAHAHVAGQQAVAREHVVVLAPSGKLTLLLIEVRAVVIPDAPRAWPPPSMTTLRRFGCAASALPYGFAGRACGLLEGDVLLVKRRPRRRHRESPSSCSFIWAASRRFAHSKRRRLRRALALGENIASSRQLLSSSRRQRKAAAARSSAEEAARGAGRVVA